MTDREKAQRASEEQQEKLKNELGKVSEVRALANKARGLLARDSFVSDIERAMARRA